jgi:hypothetical protein
VAAARRIRAETSRWYGSCIDGGGHRSVTASPSFPAAVLPHILGTAASPRRGTSNHGASPHRSGGRIRGRRSSSDRAVVARSRSPSRSCVAGCGDFSTCRWAYTNAVTRPPRVAVHVSRHMPVVRCHGVAHSPVGSVRGCGAPARACEAHGRARTCGERQLTCREPDHWRGTVLTDLNERSRHYRVRYQ